jgi:hypothetical protein
VIWPSKAAPAKTVAEIAHPFHAANRVEKEGSTRGATAGVAREVAMKAASPANARTSLSYGATNVTRSFGSSAWVNE